MYWISIVKKNQPFNHQKRTDMKKNILRLLLLLPLSSLIMMGCNKEVDGRTDDIAPLQPANTDANAYIGMDKPFDVKTSYTNEFLDRSVKMTK